MSDVYIRVRPLATVFDSRELVEGEVIADFGPDGELIGVEVLTATGVRVDGKPVAATPADDDVLMTADWLTACGVPLHGETTDATGFYLGCHALYVLFTGGRVEVCPPIGKAIMVNPTRGRFRRLCAVLDIPLKEAK